MEERNDQNVINLDFSKLDAMKIYTEIFSKKKEVIKEVLQYYKSNGCTIALWGAGKKGIAFLKLFDLENKKIDYIFDIDEKKKNCILETGHKVVDYHEYKPDIVLVANASFELEVIHLLKVAHNNAQVINIEHIIWGDLNVENVLFPCKKVTQRIRNSKICGIVIVYNPDEQKVMENIASYIKEIDYLYIYDNSEMTNQKLIEYVDRLDNAEYITKNENRGLPEPFNEVAENAANRGFDWLITFDQDSIASKGMIDELRDFVNSPLCDDFIAIVAPVVNGFDHLQYVQERYCTYCEKIIQSGAMHNIKILNKVKYNEELFIDEVDNEYCIRCILADYKIVQINTALLMHNQQDDKVSIKYIDGKKVHFNKYSAQRYYYRCRNALYCYDKFENIYPNYALDCLNTLRRIQLNIQCNENKKNNMLAIEQAVKDFRNKKMGVFIS